MSTPDDGAPAATPRPAQTSRIAGTHGHRTARIAVAVLSAVTVVATLGSTVAWAGLNNIADNISKQEIQAGTNRPTKAAPTEPTEYEALNVLVMGTDTRTGQGNDFGDPGTTASGNGHSGRRRDGQAHQGRRRVVQQRLLVRCERRSCGRRRVARPPAARRGADVAKNVAKHMSHTHTHTPVSYTHLTLPTSDLV